MKAVAVRLWVVAGGLAGVVVFVTTALATNWTVTWEPSGSVDLVGAVVAQTADGDTILVGPGTYYEHIPIPDHALTIIGTDGPATTILDGSQPIPGRQTSVLYTLQGHLPSFAIHGLTVQGGWATYVPALDREAGAGLLINNLSGYGTTPVSISDCVFTNNTSWSGGSGGGGFFLVNVLADIENCEFRTNITANGTHAYIEAGAATFRDCEFFLEDTIAAYGAAVFCYAGDLLIEDCTIHGSPHPSQSETCIQTNGGQTTLRRNRFLDEEYVSATSVIVNSDFIVGGADQRVTLDANLFWRKGVTPGGELGRCLLSFVMGEVDVFSNTFIHTKMSVSLGSGAGDAGIRNNIFAESSCAVLSSPGGVVECNDVWPDAEAMDIRCCGTVLGPQIVLDPLFCDPTNGNFSLAAESPCAADNSPDGCGLIGAYDIECSVVPVKSVTWGQIKQLFR